MAVSVGTPPPEGWKWVVAELITAADEVKEATTNHGFFWIFYVVKGSIEVGTDNATKAASAGEGIMVAAGENHTHRYLPQSKVLIFDVRSTNDNPTAFHRGTRLFVSDKLDLPQAPDYKMQIQQFTLEPGKQTRESTKVNPDFIYVEEGTLTVFTPTSSMVAQAGKAFPLPPNVTYIRSNEGTVPARFLLVEVRP
ncbi:MAG: hypothetical protein AABZ77_04145 [Chloroflexota bacterium]